ncbi:hypothetical protein IAD21_01351 [Abditibacteriota bacterium]|nr:hypothetical protein IAD21_01351 [Abditibacteriota bacterium]
MESSDFANGVRRTALTNSENPSPIQDTPTSGIEKRLSQSAPVLPAALRNRTLNQCAVRAEAERRRQKRLHWQLVATVAGVMALQMMMLFAIDAQNTQILAGNSKPPLFASLSVSELNQLWHQRSRQLAQLMRTSEIG